MIVVHGEDQIASRHLFIKLKQESSQQGANVVELESDFGLEVIAPLVESQSLFGQSNSLFIQGIFSTKPSNAKKQLIEYLLANQDKDIYIWEGKDVSAQLKEFDPKQVKRFDLPKHIFSFMNEPSVPGLHKCLESMPIEQVFASLVTRYFKQHKSRELMKLLDLDYKSKTSQLPYDLTGALELFLTKG